MPALEAKTTSTIQDTVDAINSLSPLVATKVLNSMTANEIRAIVGLIPTESGEQVVPDGATFAEFSKTKFSEDDIIAMFAEYGESRSDYAIFKTREVFSSSVNDMEEEMNLEFAEQALTVLEANILDLIQKDKRISPEIIAGTIKTDVNIVKRVLEGLKDRKIIKSTNENGTAVNVLVNPLSKLNAPKPQTTTFQLRYSYQFKTIIPINERNSLDHPSRPFCARLMQLDRLYTRAEIESLSARLGYSVFDRRGGWWTMPNGEASPSCRHRWMTETVIKKG
jgi:hypothetical protein